MLQFDSCILLQTNVVVPSPKSQAIGEEFDHRIAHALSCILESEDMSDMGYGGLQFGSLDEEDQSG